MKFSVPGFFWGGKFGKYFFGGLIHDGARVVLRFKDTKLFGPIQSSLSLKIGRFALLSSPPLLETLVRSSISTN